jgi:hypothetical protein
MESISLAFFATPSLLDGLLARYDPGGHVHSKDEGYRAMAD